MKNKYLPLSIILPLTLGLIFNSCNNENKSAQGSVSLDQSKTSYSLGALGAFGQNLTTEIEVPSASDSNIKVYPGGVILSKISSDSILKKAGLKSGDIIYGVDKTNLKVDSNQIINFIKLIELSCARNKTTTLHYYRNGKALQANVELEQTNIDAIANNKITRFQELANDACSYLAKKQKADGSFSIAASNQDILNVATSGLAFIANGNTSKAGNQQQALQKCVNYIKIQVKNPNKLNALAASYSILFLSEVARDNEEIINSIKPVREHLLSLIEKENTWENSDDSIAVNSSYVTNYALLALAASERLGLDAVKEEVTSKIFTNLSKRHNLTNRANTKSLEVGRCASLLTALNLFKCPKTDPQYVKLSQYVKDNAALLIDSPTCRIPFLTSMALLSHQSSQTSWQDFIRNYRYLLVSLQKQNGSFSDYPSDSDIQHPALVDIDTDIWNTANLALICSLQNNKLIHLSARSQVSRSFMTCNTYGKRISISDNSAAGLANMGSPAGRNVITLDDPEKIKQLLDLIGGQAGLDALKEGGDKTLKAKPAPIDIEKLKEILGKNVIDKMEKTPKKNDNTSKDKKSPEK